MSFSFLICDIFFCLLLIQSCQKIEKTEETYPQGARKKVISYAKSLFSNKTYPVALKEYYFNGNPKFSVGLKSGRFHGPSRSWYIKGGLKSQGAYRQGAKHGPWQFFFKDKILSSQGEYRKGKKHGRWKSWWENKALKSTGIYQEGEKTGNWQTWNSLGQRRKINSCFAKNDTGAYTTFHPNGTVDCHYRCHYGKPVGPFTVNNPEGALLELGYYSKSHKKEGVWKKWHQNREPASTIGYNDGLWVDTIRTWDSLGRLLTEGVFRKGTGELVRYDTTGTVRAKESHVSGLKHGDQWTYFPTGSPHTRQVYCKDTLMAEMQWYLKEDQKDIPVLAMSGKYQSGKKHGLWLWFSKAAVLVESAHFKDGMRHGISKFFNPKTSRLQRTQEYHNGMPTNAVLESISH
jgi:antitoxin component YwqK of YwqJK toxin-antitoxin module